MEPSNLNINFKRLLMVICIYLNKFLQKFNRKYKITIRLNLIK